MSLFTELRDAIKTKSKEIVKRVTFLKPKLASILGASFDISLSAEIDSAIKIILDDSFLKVIDRAIFALDSTIDKTSQELQSLAQKIFDNLFELEKRLNTLIDNFFQHLSALFNNIKANLVDPIVDSIFKLEEKIFEDINQVIDKIFNFFTGTVKEFKDDLLRLFNPLPNPFDPCRQQFGLALTPTSRLTHTDIFNLFECSQLRRLNDGNTIVKEIQEIYAGLQLESFKMTCLGRGSPSFQELYMRKWLKYGQLFEIWQEFNENMTPQEAFDEAIRRLNEARDEYNAKVADIDRAQATADDAINRANNAQNTANDGVNRAINAQNTADIAVSKADGASLCNKKIALQSVHGGFLSDRNDDGGNGRFVGALGSWEEHTVICR
jgi:prefoldin subunit 5